MQLTTPLPVPSATPATPATPGAKAPAGAAPGQPGAKPDLAAVVNMPVADAVKAATSHLAKLLTMTVGGGTKEGIAAARQAAALLQDTSLLVQVVHRNALASAKQPLAPETEINLMMLASGMAGASAQVASAGAASTKPLPLKDLLAKPSQQAIEILVAVAGQIADVQPPAAAPAKP